LHAGESFALPTERTLLARATLCAVRGSPRCRTANLFAFASGDAFSTDAGLARIADDRLAGSLNTGRAGVAVFGEVGTAKRSGDTNAATAFFLRGIATVAGAAGELKRFAANP
jgi:hypothetical protein